MAGDGNCCWLWIRACVSQCSQSPSATWHCFVVVFRCCIAGDDHAAAAAAAVAGDQVDQHSAGARANTLVGNRLRVWTRPAGGSIVTEETLLADEDAFREALASVFGVHLGEAVPVFEWWKEEGVADDRDGMASDGGGPARVGPSQGVGAIDRGSLSS